MLPQGRSLSTAARLYPARLIALVAVFGITVAVGVSAVSLQALRSSRAQAIDASHMATRNIAQAVTNAVARAVQSVDVLLLSTATAFADSGAGAGRLGGQMSERLDFMPHVRQLLVVGRDGTVLYDTVVGRTGQHMEVEALFRRHAQSARPLVIGPAEHHRFLGEEAESAHSLIPFSRLVVDRAGNPVAAVVAAVNPLYFKAIFDGIEMDDGSQIRLWLFDGTLLVGESGAADYQPNAHAGELLFTKYLKQGEFGSYQGVDADGTERVTSYRMTLTWPLVISVSAPVEAVLQRWRHDASLLGGLVAGLVVFTLILTAVLVAALIRRGRAEAMLRLSDRVLETMSNGVAITDATRPGDPIVYVNPAFEAITGYSAAQVLGRNPRFLHAEEREQPGLAEIRRAIREHDSGSAVLKNFRADGSVYWNDLSVSAVRGASGQVTHFVGIQRDITAEEEARADLSQAYARIERYSAELERFSFILAHHLQEPNRHIMLYAQMVDRLLVAKGDESLVEPLAYLSAAAARLKGLLRDVQSYLAIDRLVITGSGCSASEVLDREWERRAESARGVTLIRGKLPELGLAARRLADLFGVLLDNSLLYRHPDRPLRIVVDAEPEAAGMWQLRLADNGIGIHPDDQVKAFAVFERLHTRESHGHTGNGIGLAIARKIVELAGGRIWIESDGRDGTAFLFTLPGKQGESS